MRIIIIENHPETLKVLTTYLQQMEHTVFSAGSIREALQVLQAKEFDVLLSDIRLPDGDGWELLRRANIPKSVYTIGMSGFWGNADRVKSRDAGFDHHLLKPFDPDELDSVLAEADRQRVR